MGIFRGPWHLFPPKNGRGRRLLTGTLAGEMTIWNGHWGAHFGEEFHRSPVPFPPGVSGMEMGTAGDCRGNGKDHTDPGFLEAGEHLVVLIGLLFVFGWAVVPV